MDRNKGYKTQDNKLVTLIWSQNRAV